MLSLYHKFESRSFLSLSSYILIGKKKKKNLKAPKHTGYQTS